LKKETVKEGKLAALGDQEKSGPAVFSARSVWERRLRKDEKRSANNKQS